MPISRDPRNQNRWRYQYNRVIQGRRYRASRLLPAGWSKAQAEAYDRKEGARLTALATGVEETDHCIDEAVKLYIADKQHLKSFKQTVEHLAAIAWAYEGKSMSELADVARSVIEYPYAKPWSPATIHNRLACLKAACRWAWKKHGLTKHDPTARMVLPTVNNARHVYRGRRDMLRACRACTNRNARIAIRVGFYTGMRLGELFKVSVEGDVMMLPPQSTKNGQARAIPAHPKIKHLLKHLPLVGPKITVQRAWMVARDKVGLHGMHFHDWRHSAASEMINNGVPLHTVGKVLGHLDQRSSSRYAHLETDVIADAIWKIGQKSSHKGKKAA